MDRGNKEQEQNLNPDNEFRNSEHNHTEIEQPSPDIATPSIPQELPVREG